MIIATRYTERLAELRCILEDEGLWCRAAELTEASAKRFLSALPDTFQVEISVTDDCGYYIKATLDCNYLAVLAYDTVAKMASSKQDTRPDFQGSVDAVLDRFIETLKDYT